MRAGSPEGNPFFPGRPPMAGIQIVHEKAIIAPAPDPALRKGTMIPRTSRLTFGVLAALGCSFLGTLPNNLILARWFERGRGTAIGIVSSGFGGGVFIFMPALALVIRGGRWRAGYFVLAAALLALAPLLLLLQRPRPAAGPPRASAGPGPAALKPRRLSAALSRPRFWFTYAQYILGPLSTTPLIIHQAALMRDRGMGEMQAAWIVALFGLAALIGMIAAGVLSDGMGRERAYTLGTVGIIAGCAALLALPVRVEGAGGFDGHAIAYAALFGFGFGTRPSMDAATAADIFRGPGFGPVYGVLSTALGIGQIAAPVLAGAIHDATGSYAAAIVFCIAAAVVATASIWLAAPRRGLEPA